MKNIPRTGKRYRPKTAIKGKRYHCATCHKRSPRPVKTPAPWYCPTCAAAARDLQAAREEAEGYSSTCIGDPSP